MGTEFSGFWWHDLSPFAPALGALQVKNGIAAPEGFEILGFQMILPIDAGWWGLNGSFHRFHIYTEIRNQTEWLADPENGTSQQDPLTEKSPKCFQETGMDYTKILEINSIGNSLIKNPFIKGL